MGVNMSDNDFNGKVYDFMLEMKELQAKQTVLLESHITNSQESHEEIKEQISKTVARVRALEDTGLVQKTYIASIGFLCAVIGAVSSKIPSIPNIFWR